MADKPTLLPSWATNGGSTIVTPPSGNVQTGWVPGKKCPAQYANYLQSLNGQWIDYFLELSMYQFMSANVTAGWLSVPVQVLVTGSNSVWVPVAWGETRLFDPSSFLEAEDATGQACTVHSDTNVIDCTNHGFENGDTVRFTASVYPYEVVAAYHFWVRDKTTSTFKIANYPGGAAVDLTSTGTSVLVHLTPTKIRVRGEGVYTVDAECQWENAESVTGERGIGVSVNGALLHHTLEDAVATGTGYQYMRVLAPLVLDAGDDVEVVVHGTQSTGKSVANFTRVHLKKVGVAE